MTKMLIFGMGYTASRLARQLRMTGWEVTGTRREASNGSLAFGDTAAILAALDDATHILSSVPPSRDGSEPVLAQYGEAIASADLQWSGYLSSTGVYGDAGGAWVDESAQIGTGRRKARSEADRNWQDLRPDMRVFRLPGIYGPGRSPLDRVRSGKARRIDVPGQVFSRIHADDIVGAVLASFDRPAGVFNIADDLPAAQSDVLAHAARLMGMEPPPLMTLEEADLSAAARSFYDENRRVANGRAKRLLGWEPRYPDYKSGLAALLES
ncbi:Nucleoside-diphosphate-sugar epimerase [Parasphingorhabdus marina DSM 22363]|uniref:Nucleoside-diphosphate-sugar epimerase n=1 Tax=Parasphingorhabdus marina DSM 22363 TaxID=1123272 RepID=A0A1N6DDW8_9SPHN|nr:SDR family oxidoreductase [Parasphingorhabdus marina]SIN68975.1 Nucleoside-diphosphate-sugar epimerase [Parasphingorhabdus marina DSM 22363]